MTAKEYRKLMGVESTPERKAQTKGYFSHTKKQTGINRYGKKLTEKQEVQSPFVSWFREVVQPRFPHAMLIVCPFADMNFAPSEYYTDPRQKQFKGKWMDAAQAHNIKIMSDAKAEGFEKSNPDVLIVHHNGQYSGLAMELKRSDVTVYNKNGTLRKVEHLKAQESKLNSLKANNWKAEFVCGLDAAKKMCCEYFGLEMF